MFTTRERDQTLWPGPLRRHGDPCCYTEVGEIDVIMSCDGSMSSASRRDSRQVPILLHSEKGGEEFLPTCVHCHVVRSTQFMFPSLSTDTL